jgi:hypothetical protein
MEEIVVRINNNKALSLLENLEDLNIIKVMKRMTYPHFKPTNESKDRDVRLSEIQAVTGNINIDLSNFHFNRDEANNYDA